MQCAKVYVKIYASPPISQTNVLCKNKTAGIMQLSCRFNVYNRDTKVNFKPLNE